MIFAKAGVVGWICSLLAPHNASAKKKNKQKKKNNKKKHAWNQFGTHGDHIPSRSKGVHGVALPSSVKDQAGEENDEEVVGVPEDLEIAASDDLHGRGDDEDEGQGDDDARQAGDGGEGEVGGNLLRVLDSSCN